MTNEKRIEVGQEIKVKFTFWGRYGHAMLYLGRRRALCIIVNDLRPQLEETWFTQVVFQNTKLIILIPIRKADPSTDENSRG